MPLYLLKGTEHIGGDGFVTHRQFDPFETEFSVDNDEKAKEMVRTVYKHVQYPRLFRMVE